MRMEAPPAVRAPCFATTAGIPTREKFNFWRDVVCRNLVDLDYTLLGKAPFDATFTGSRVAHLNLSRIDASQHIASRSSTSIARSDSESLVFNFVLSGSLMSEQDGRTARLDVGDGAFCDAQRPYRLHSDAPYAIASVQLPRHVISSRISGVHRLSALNLCQKSELGSLVFAYLARLIERAPMLDGATGTRVGQNFTDLLISMLADIIKASPLPLTEYRSLALLRVKDVVERHLADSRLGPDMVAAELKASSRYINQLLEAENTSLTRYIWQRRVERSAEQLRDPALRGRTISMIAFDNGFRDLSHFSKTFHLRYGIAPRGYRAQHKSD